MLAGVTFADILGVIGSAMVCGAYWAVSSGRVEPRGLPYHVINAIGASLLLVSLWFRPNAGAIIVEGLWLIIALGAIWRTLRVR